jgi:hypothetical protein
MHDRRQGIAVAIQAAIIIVASARFGYADTRLDARNVGLLYEQTKQFIAERAAKDKQETEDIVQEAAKNPDDAGKAVIHWCGEYTEVNGIPDDGSRVEMDLINLAGGIQEYTGWLEALARVGYPKHFWLTYLSNFERAQLARIKAGQHFVGTRVVSKLMVDSLEKWEEKNTGLKLPRIAWSNICGDFGRLYLVYFRASPANGDIAIISAFFFNLCRKRGDPPLDRSRCNYWRSTIPSKGDPVAAGQYYIYTLWSDGVATGPKLVDFNRVSDGDVINIDHP